MGDIKKFNINGGDKNIKTPNIDIIYNNSFYDFGISDESGNFIFKEDNGHIQTKYFNSENISDIQLSNKQMNYDFAISDDSYNTIFAVKDGHILTKNFDSKNIDITSTTKRNIKILFIGNSISQDHVTYLPYILKTLYSETLSFTIGIFYIGGWTIKQYVTDTITKKKNADIFSIANNTESWSNQSNITLEYALKLYPWDIISIQGYYKTTEDVETYGEDFIRYIKDTVENPFALAWLMHQSFNIGTTVDSVISGAEYAITHFPISILFSPCFATELAKTFLTQSQITPDSTHNQEGLPCQITAMHMTEVITRHLGIPSKILGNKIKMIRSLQQTLSIPGPNGTPDDTLFTDNNIYLSQNAAIQSVNISEAFFYKTSLQKLTQE